MNRWKTMDRVFFVIVGLLAAFAYYDSKQITSFFMMNNPLSWNLYEIYTAPAIRSMWTVAILAVGIIWYLIYKDKSEAVALSGTGLVLQAFGVQDFMYFIFSGIKFSAVGCWANSIYPVKVISDFLGECCPTATSFVLSAIIGVVVSYYLYKWLQKAKW